MHRYLINQWNKILKGVLILPFFFLSVSTYSQSLFESLEQSYQSDQENYPKLLQKHLNKNLNLSKIEDFSMVKFHPFFLDNLVFNNKNEILSLGLKDECSLIDLMGTELLYSSTGKLRYVLIELNSSSGENEIHTLTKAAYLNSIGYKKCPKSKKLKAYFSFANLKRTLKREKLVFPKSLSECKETHKNFINDVKAPYLCEIAHKVTSLPQDEIALKNLSKANIRKYQAVEQRVREARTFKSIVNPTALDFLDNLCKRSYNSSKYCEEVFAETYWTNSLSGLVTQAPLQTFCSAYLGKEKVTSIDLKLCSNAFAAKNDLCRGLIPRDQALSPQPSCSELSTALNFSRLFKNYSDCPITVGHMPLVTASRILSHFNKTVVSGDKNCELNSIHPFAEFNQKFLESEQWQINLCYEDKILRKNTCRPTTFHHIENSELSLSYVMGKTLARLRGFNDKDQTCKVITDQEYKPTLLEFKSGCFIVKESANCFGVDCKFRVYLDDQLFENYTIESKLQFDLTPFRYTEANKSFLSLLEKHYQKESKKVLNISSIKRIFENKKDAIIMGLGCLEELLPSLMKSSSFNQCSITPFIVDGIIEVNSSYSLITRTSLDHIHAPRIIPWTQVFSSVKNYKRFQPLNEWSLYAIY